MGQIWELVRGSVEETLNELLEKEAEPLTQAARYERSEARHDYCSGHYGKLTTTSINATLHMPHLKGVSFETTIIKRYRRRESSMEEILNTLSGSRCAARRISQRDSGSARYRPSPSAGSTRKPMSISGLARPPPCRVAIRSSYVNGIYLRWNWSGEYENVAILVATAINKGGYREVLGVAESMK